MKLDGKFYGGYLFITDEFTDDNLDACKEILEEQIYRTEQALGKPIVDREWIIKQLDKGTTVGWKGRIE